VEGINFIGQGSSRTPTRTTTINSIPSNGNNPPGSSHPVVPISSSTPSLHGTTFRSVLARSPAPSYTIKVVQAKLKKGRKIVLETLEQLHILLTESTANVGSIVSTIQQARGSDHTIVTSDGLKMDNPPATQGIFDVYNLWSSILFYHCRTSILEGPK